MMWNTETALITFITLSLWIEYLWELFLSIRQINIYRTRTTIPPELKGILDEETFQKARLYGLDKGKYGVVKDFYSTIISTGTILYGWLAVLWTCGEGTTKLFDLDVNNEIINSIFFIVIVNTVTFVIDMPFTIYSTFRLEAKHGFNKQTPLFFIKDQIKGYLLSQILSAPIIAVVVYIVQRGGDMFIFYLWLFSCVLILLLLMIYPSLIAPLFDKYTTLPESNLRNRIYELAGSLNFPLGQLYVVEGSKRSAHSNAYFYGLFGSKRIVLFDTLLENYKPAEESADKTENENKEDNKDKKKEKSKGCNDDEVVAVLAHELGHWKHMHIYKNLFVMQLNLLLTFYCFGKIFRYPPLYKVLGFSANKMPIIVGLGSILQLILAPYNALLSFVMTVLSRRYEFQADNFAVELGHSKKLQSALIKLNVDNLSFPIYDPFYSAWHHSHPPLLERLENLKTKEKKTK